MKSIINSVLLISLLLQANFLAADIFRKADDNGHVSFSDKRSTDATAVKSIRRDYRYKQQVAYVYDGDTITLKNGDRIRLLGINTPEIKSRYRQGEAGGQKAKKWLQDKLSDGEVFLEYDHQQRDKYKRRLAHLFLANGEHLNKEMLKLGLASLSIIPPNIKYHDALIKAELSARKRGVGIWSMKAYQPIPVERLSKKIEGWHRYLATPNKITKSRRYIRLILNKHVDMRIAKENLALFPDLELYLGKSLEIRGWAYRNKDHYSILVRHPSAISVL